METTTKYEQLMNELNKKIEADNHFIRMMKAKLIKSNLLSTWR